MKGKILNRLSSPGLSIAVATLMVLGYSCSHRDTGETLPQTDGLQYRANFQSGHTKWQINDQMGVTSFISGTVREDNVLYLAQTEDGIFGSATPIQTLRSLQEEIIAYYPYNSAVSEGLIPMSYTSQREGKAPDYFYGLLSSTPSGERDYPTVSLRRINALLQIVITASPDFGDLSHLQVEMTDVPLSGCFDMKSGHFSSRGAVGTLPLAVTGRRGSAVAAGVVIPDINYGEVVVKLTYNGRSIEWHPTPYQGKMGEVASYHLTLSGSGSGIYVTETKGPGELPTEAPEGPIVLTPDGLIGERYDPYDPKYGAKPVDPTAGIDPTQPSPTQPSVNDREDVPISPSAGVDPLDPADMDPSIKGDETPSEGVPIDPSTGEMIPLNPGGDFTVKDQEDVPIDPSTPGIDPSDPDEPTPGVDPNDPLGNVRPGVVARYREEAVVRDANLLDHAIFVRHMAPDSWFADGGSGTRRNYSILFDTKNYSPRYVAFPMYPGVIGNSGRTDRWDYDPELSTTVQPQLYKSYLGHWSRGHMLASSSRTASRRLNATTFYFSNMIPQNQEQNGGQWNQLENKERAWAQQVSKYDTLYVVCGPVYSKEPLQMTKDRAGKQIPVPDATYKVFLRQEKSTGNWHSIGFIMPNRSLSGTKYSAYAVPVSEVERQTGLQFFTHLPKDKAVSIKSQNDPSHWR